MQPSLPPKPTGNGFFPLFTATVLKHVGIPVFLTGLSSAHTFSNGSPAPSYTPPVSTPPAPLFPTRAAQPTATVTSKLVPSTCRICVIPHPAPSSYAGNRRTTFQLGPTMRTSPSGLPRNRLSEPQHRAEMLLPAKRSASASGGGAICVVSKKVKDRHCGWGGGG